MGSESKLPAAAAADGFLCNRSNSSSKSNCSNCSNSDNRSKNAPFSH